MSVWALEAHVPSVILMGKPDDHCCCSDADYVHASPYLATS